MKISSVSRGEDRYGEKLAMHFHGVTRQRHRCIIQKKATAEAAAIAFFFWIPSVRENALNWLFM